MRKFLMVVAASLLFVGAAITTKAASLLNVSNVGIQQDDDFGLVLKHANELYGESDMSLTGHSSHSSHRSHSSHSSHSSHRSSY